MDKNNPEDQEDADISKVMGFSSFQTSSNPPKKARQFDLLEMVNAAKRNARELQNKTATPDKQSNTVESASSSHASQAAPAKDVSDSDSDASEDAGSDEKRKDSNDKMKTSNNLEDEEGEGDNGDNDDDDDDDEEANTKQAEAGSSIPERYELLLNHSHTPSSDDHAANSRRSTTNGKPVSALDVDVNGARVISGGHDFSVRVWDFAGMTGVDAHPFRIVQPTESHTVVNVAWNATGSHFVVAAAYAQATVFSRDGRLEVETPRGFTYVTDAARADGHTHALTGCAYHPRARERFATCSQDGTVRVWNAENSVRNLVGSSAPSRVRAHDRCAKPRANDGRRVSPTCCAYSRDGALLACGCADGSLSAWDTRGLFVNTSLHIRDAHRAAVTGFAFSYDDRHIATRSLDDTMKLWDVRNLKKPEWTQSNLATLYDQTDCTFSPNDRLVLTGTSIVKAHRPAAKKSADTHEGVPDEGARAQLLAFNRDTGELRQSIFSDSSIIRVAWHPKLNQAFLARADGYVAVLYDNATSRRGALLCAGRAARRKQIESVAAPIIISPFALPLFRDTRGGVRARTRTDRDGDEQVQIRFGARDRIPNAGAVRKNYKPQPPINGPGSGGRLAEKGQTLSHYVLLNVAKRQPETNDLDARAAILRHAEEAERNPKWIAPAYAKTQNVPIFQAVTDEAEEDEERKKAEEPAWKKMKI